ncbi:MAG: type II toxin-antitoxin system RelE/ParE family toxin [Spirochaetota bacterium]|jgi:mRNA interferase RelE/StbE|nr:type II toxin-antitoxin system RelE/ParE family toxin [Spirochaetota bacterium]
MQIKLHHNAQKYLDRLPATARNRIQAAFDGLSENPPKGDIRPYIGTENAWRLKVKDFRVIYIRDMDVIVVTYIEPRGQAYTRKTRNKRG